MSSLSWVDIAASPAFYQWYIAIYASIASVSCLPVSLPACIDMYFWGLQCIARAGEL
jgi:hypothetical protein